MEFTLAHIRVLLAAIFLIAGSAVASAAPLLSGAVGANSVETNLSRHPLALAEPGIEHEATALAAGRHDCNQDRCMQDCRMDCAGSATSGCCATAIPIAAGNVLDRAAIAACGIAGIGFLPTGIDPDALLRPPRSHV